MFYLASAYYNLGLCFVGLGRCQEAQRHIQQGWPQRVVHRYLSNYMLRQDQAANTSVPQISSQIQLFTGSRISHFWSVSVSKRAYRRSLSTVLSLQRNVLLIPGVDVLSQSPDEEPQGASLNTGMMRNSIRWHSAPNPGALQVSSIRNLWEEMVEPDGHTASLLAEWRRGVSSFLSLAVSSVSTAAAENKMMEMSQGCRGTVCETRCESGWLLRRRACVQHVPIMSWAWALSHTHAWKCESAMLSSAGTLTRLRKMCVRRGVLSSPSRHVHDIRSCLYAKSVNNIYECARILQSGCHIGFAKSLQPSLFPPLVISPLVISPLSVLVFAPLRVLTFVLPPLLWRWWRGRRLRPEGFPILNHLL